MSTAATQQFPDDPQALKALLAERTATLERQGHELDALKAKLAWFEEQWRLAQAKRFGAASEQAPGQARLFDEAEAEAEPLPAEETITYRRTKRGRRRLPADLPREQRIHDLPEAERVCTGCGAGLHRIGEERSEELEFIPARLKVIEHVTVKYGCRGCEEGVARAPTPARPIPGSIASPALLASVAVAKYADGLPLYRQSEIFARLGVELPRATLAGWMVRAGQLVEPLITRLHAHLIAEPVLHADETPVQVLREPGRPAQSKSTMWVYASGERAPPMLLYDYREGRAGAYPAEMLAGFRGYLQTDGYNGYRRLVETEPITGVGCLAHLRRKFVEVQRATPAGASHKAGTRKADAAMEMIGGLYAIERAIKAEGLDVAATAERHQHEAAPILERLHAWLVDQSPRVPPKSLLGRAISYALGQWPYVIRYVEDGRLAIDNNRAERAIKPFVMGRKAWLFSATPGGAQASARLYSLAQSARENGLDPQAYLQHVFERLPNLDTENTAELDDLLPHRINPAAIEQT